MGQDKWWLQLQSVTRYEWARTELRLARVAVGLGNMERVVIHLTRASEWRTSAREWRARAAMLAALVMLVACGGSVEAPAEVTEAPIVSTYQVTQTVGLYTLAVTHADCRKGDRRINGGCSVRAATSEASITQNEPYEMNGWACSGWTDTTRQDLQLVATVECAP